MHNRSTGPDAPAATNDARSNFGPRGWILVFIGMLCFYVGTGAVNDGLNTIVPMFTERYGWDSGTLLAMSSVSGILSGIGGIFLGVLVNKFGVKKMMLFSIGLLAVSTFSWGFVKSVPLYFICLLGCVLAQGGMGQLGLPILAGNWFPRKKGLIMGWVTMGANVCSATINWLLVGAAALWGFHGGFNSLAVIAIIAFILLAIFIREYPEQCGCFPDNDASMTKEEAVQIQRENEKYIKTSPFTVKKLLKTKQTWQVALYIGAVQMVTGGCVSQLVPTIESYGFTRNYAMATMTVCAIIGLFGSYLVGWFDAKYGTKRTILGFQIMTAVLCLFMVLPWKWTVYVAAFLVGISMGGSNNLFGSYMIQIFGRYDQKRATTVAFPIYQITRTMGTGFIGVLASRFGSYSVPYAILALLLIVVFFATWKMNDACIGRHQLSSDNSN